MKNNQLYNFLVVFETIGAIFSGSFLIAYLLGLPTDVVYHSDPNLRLFLLTFSGIFILLALIAIIAFIRIKK